MNRGQRAINSGINPANLSASIAARLRRKSESQLSESETTFAHRIISGSIQHRESFVSVSKRSFLTLVSGVCLLALTSCKQQVNQAAGGPPVVPVSAAKATQESVPTELRVVGPVEASAIVQGKSQIAGQLMRLGL